MQLQSKPKSSFFPYFPDFIQARLITTFMQDIAMQNIADVLDTGEHPQLLKGLP